MAATIVPGVIVHKVLNQDNYEDWSFRVKTHLLAKGLWYVVVSTTEPPKEEDGEAEFNAWSKNNAEALHAIHISCGDDTFSFIRGITSARDAWKTLGAKLKQADQVPKTTEEISDAHMNKNTIDGDAAAAGPKKDLAIEAWAEEEISYAHTNKNTIDGDAAAAGPKKDMAIEARVEVTESSDDESSDLERLFRDVKRGNWDAAKSFLKKNPGAIRTRYSRHGGYTIICCAIRNRQVHIAKELMQMMKEEDFEIRDHDGFTCLTYAVAERLTEIVKDLIKKNKKIVTMTRPPQNCTPVLDACSLGYFEIADILYKATPLEVIMGGPNDGRDGAELIFQSFFSNNVDIAWDLINRSPNLSLTEGHFGHYPVNALAGVQSAFFSGTPLSFWQKWIYHWIQIQPIPTSTNDLRFQIEDDQGDHQPDLIRPGVGLFRGFGLFRGLLLKLLGIKDIYEMKLAHVRTVVFLRFISNWIQSKSLSEREVQFLQTALFRAVERGHVEFIYHICKDNPAMLMIADGEGVNLLHNAVKCRQAGVYNLIYRMMKKNDRSLAFNSTHEVNTILYVAGSLSPNLNQIQGEALQMQSELRWFKELKSIVRPEMIEINNSADRKTAQELFTENHKDLMKEAEKSMKETATSSTVVGALIVTMMFAAAFTLPGGNNGDTGSPMFLGKQLFMVFIISDSISLFSSTTSVMIFLGMLTSRYAEEDFLKSLPTKMILGLFTLFLSIASMMVAFSVALIIMLKEQYSWIVIPVTLLAGVPVASFAWMQFPLLVNIFFSTYGKEMFYIRKSNAHLKFLIPNL